MNYYMGIDVGTSSTKALLIDENGLEVGEASKKYDVLYPKPDYAEQDPEEIWGVVKEVLCELVKKYPQIIKNLKGISYSGQMHGLLLIDRENKPTCNMIIWQDHRSIDQKDKIYGIVPFEEYNRRTLNQLSPGYLIMSLMWIKENRPDIYDRSAMLLLPKDYIRYRMGGGLGTDYSDASATVIFDPARKEWPWDLIDRLGLRRDLFPECHESYDISGKVSKECAEETGLPAGIPITFGGGDTLMHEIGANLISPDNSWVSNIGTACQVTCVADTPIYDRQFRTNTFCCVKKDLWMLQAVGMCGGAAMKWMQGILGIQNFEAMNELAAEVAPGSDGVIFLPYLCGSRCPQNDPVSKGIYFGLSLEHGKGHFIRSTMEGVVYGLRSDYELLKELTGHDTDRIIATGGGARGQLFLQIQADIFKKPVYTTVSAEQSCLGAAITAAVGTGYFSDYEQACSRIVKLNDAVTEPIPENCSRYDEYYEVYRHMYDSNKELFQKLPRHEG